MSLSLSLSLSPGKSIFNLWFPPRNCSMAYHVWGTISFTISSDSITDRKSIEEWLTVSCHKDRRARSVIVAQAQPPPHWDCYSFRNGESISFRTPNSFLPFSPRPSPPFPGQSLNRLSIVGHCQHLLSRYRENESTTSWWRRWRSGSTIEGREGRKKKATGMRGAREKPPRLSDGRRQTERRRTRRCASGSQSRPTSVAFAAAVWMTSFRRRRRRRAVPSCVFTTGAARSARRVQVPRDVFFSSRRFATSASTHLAPR